MVDYSQDQFKQSNNTVLAGLGGGIAAAIALVALVIYLVMRRIVLDPVEEIAEVAESISRGSLDRQIAVRSNDEIGVLWQDLQQHDLPIA